MEKRTEKGSQPSEKLWERVTYGWEIWGWGDPKKHKTERKGFAISNAANAGTYRSRIPEERTRKGHAGKSRGGGKFPAWGGRGEKAARNKSKRKWYKCNHDDLIWLVKGLSIESLEKRGKEALIKKLKRTEETL